MKTALALREQHVTYKDIAVVMRLYHGIDRSENAWRVALRAAGAPPKHYPDGKRRAFAQ